jgi:general L-amino acid transport system permease protein
LSVRRPRAVGWQVLVAALVVAIVTSAAIQAAANLKARGIASGFDYLRRAGGFEISPGPLAYSSRDTYARALGVGLVNTLRVSALGVLIATGLGLLVGIARLSRVRIVSILAAAYLEILRNTPLLLQLLFWYSVFQALPGPHAALHPLPGVLLCNRGLFLPGLSERPAVVGFDIHGGLSVSPEFGALLLCLSTYTAAFIGETVRGGILSVGKGQTEAAYALGLSRGRALRLVVLPQALGVILPPATSQYLSLVKNSSLAVAIGYPELISITTTTLNQTGQAIEAITVAMILYLAISLGVSLAMHRWGGARR